MRQEGKECFWLHIRLGLYSRGKTFHTPSEEKEDYSACSICISQFQQCNRVAFAHVVSPGGGAFAILQRPWGWAFAYPGATPGHLTHVFLKVPWISSTEKTRRLWSNGLSVRDQKHLSMFFQACFLNFGYFFIYLKYLVLKTKYKGMNIIRRT